MVLSKRMLRLNLRYLKMGMKLPLLTLLASYINSVSSNDIWQPVTVSTGLLNNVVNKNQIIYTGCDLTCAVTASRVSWASLFCFNAGLCRISSYQTASSTSLVSIADPEVCMTNIIDGCNFNSSFFKVGAFLQVDITSPLCYLLQCQPGGGMVQYPLPTSASSGICSAPFTQTAFGCLHSNNSLMKFCESRKYCLSIGGDVWRSSYLWSLSDFRSAVGSNGCNGCFIGMYGNGSNFYWTNGSVATSVYNSMSYQGAASGDLTGTCVRHYATLSSYMYSMSCANFQPVFCEKIIQV